MLKKVGANARDPKLDTKTAKLLKEATTKAKTVYFDYVDISVSYDDGLSSCMQKLVNRMLMHINTRIAVGSRSVADAVSDGIAIASKKSPLYSSGALNDANRIVRTILADCEVDRALREARSRSQHPAGRERRRVANRGLRPVPVN